MRLFLTRHQCIYLGVLFVSLMMGCARFTDSEVSTVKISPPLKITSQSVNAQSVQELKHLILQISGPGLAAPIYRELDADGGADLSAGVEVTLPKGDGRLIQMLGVYEDSDHQGLTAYYGDVSAKIVNTVENINLDIVKLNASPFYVGRVSGKYYLQNNSNEGLTGSLEVSYAPASGAPELLIENGSIWNGWFNTLALSGLNLRYRINGELFDLKKISGSVLKNSGSMNLIDWEAVTMNKAAIMVDKSFECRGNSGPGCVVRRKREPRVQLHGVYHSPVVTNSPYISNYCLRTDNSDPSNTLHIYKQSSINTVPLTAADVFTTNDTYCNDLTGVNGCSTYGEWNPFSDTFHATLKDRLSFINAPGGTCSSNVFTLNAGSVQNWPKATFYAQIPESESGGFSGPLQMMDKGSAEITDAEKSYFDNNKFIVKGNAAMGGSTVIYARLLPDLNAATKITKAFLFLNYDYQIESRSNAFSCQAILQGSMPGFVQVTSAVPDASTHLIALPVGGAAHLKSMAICFQDANGQFYKYGYYSRVPDSTDQGGGGPVGPATQIVIEPELQAITLNQCRSVKLLLQNDNGGEVAAASNVTVNLSATGTGSAFYADGDFNCTGGPISSAVIQASTSYKTIHFITGNSPESNITLTSAAASLTSTPKIIRVRSVGNVTDVKFNPSTEAMNVGTCLEVYASASQSDGTLVSINSAFNVTVDANATSYSDNGCTIATNTINFVNGDSIFYVRSTVVGNLGIQVTTTIDGLSFSSYRSIFVASLGEPTHINLSQPSPDYLYINQCMPILASLRDDVETASTLSAAQTMNVFSSNGGANFYSDASCSAPIANNQISFPAGQNSKMFYYKPQSALGLSLFAHIYGPNQYLIGGYQDYTIGELWMHVMLNGYNGSYYDSGCSAVVFNLMNNSSAGMGTVIPNLSGSPIDVGANTNTSVLNGGYYSASDCSDSISNFDTAVIVPGNTSATIYMNSQLPAGPFISTSPFYSGTYTSHYQNGNTMSLSYAYCPPLDGGGGCASSLTASGDASGGVVAYGPVTVGNYLNKTITITNTTGSGISALGANFTGGQVADYSFLGGAFPGTAGTCGASLGAGNSCTIVVKFTANDYGGRFATLNINYSSNANAAAQIPIYLQGTGQ